MNLTDDERTLLDSTIEAAGNPEVQGFAWGILDLVGAMTNTHITTNTVSVVNDGGVVSSSQLTVWKLPTK